MSIPSARELFNQKIIEKNLFDIFMNFDSPENLRTIDFYEQNFQRVDFFKKKTFDYGSKYYLQNKQKEELNNIQESLREKVNRLNETFSDNAYFLKIEKETLEKKSNKHNYNVFRIFLVEYHKINLYSDILSESEGFFPEGFCPLKLSNITTPIKIKFYEKIIKYIQKNKNLINHDKDNNIYFHDLLLINLKREIFTFFIKLYKKDRDMKFILSEIFKLRPSEKSSAIFNIESFLTELLENPTKENLQIVDRVLNIIIVKKWDLSMNILNIALMEKILNEMNEEDVLKI